MFVSALRIAHSKSTAPAVRTALESAVPAAEALARVESAFEEKINASKAARGEKPTHMSKSEKAQVRSYADDAAALQKEQLALFEAELTSQEIVAALHAGLQSDLQFWSGAAKHTHRLDLPVLEEFVAAKKRMLESLAQCLAVLANDAT